MTEEDLYEIARSHYGDVRSLVHAESWGDGRLERILIDTERGFVSVLRMRGHWRGGVRQRPVYVFGFPCDRERAAETLSDVYEQRILAAKSIGDWGFVTQVHGRVAEEVEALLAAHPAYAGNGGVAKPASRSGGAGTRAG